MRHIKKRLKVGACISDKGKQMNEELLDEALRARADVAQRIMDIASSAYSHDELSRLSGLLADIICGPIDRVRHKSHLPEAYKEYPFLSKRQVRRRKAREIPFGGRQIDLGGFDAERD